jgi:hypothetical protein
MLIRDGKMRGGRSGAAPAECHTNVTPRAGCVDGFASAMGFYAGWARATRAMTTVTKTIGK